MHDGIKGFIRLVEALRARRFQRVVILYHSRTLAMACRAAGIPERYGYGFGRQRTFLNRPPVVLAARQAVKAHLGSRPFVVLGIGSSEPYKQWGAEKFATLAAGLARSGWPRMVLAGGSAEQRIAEHISARVDGSGADITAAIGWKLGEIAALCAEAAFYVGNDTGVMNLAAAVGTRTYGLFGAVQPFGHAGQIVPVLPPDGRPNQADGMTRITPEAVLAAIYVDRGG